MLNLIISFIINSEELWALPKTTTTKTHVANILYSVNQQLAFEEKKTRSQLDDLEKKIKYRRHTKDYIEKEKSEKETKIT